MLKNLPDIMYFGSPRQVNELSGRVFLTPHMGIASLFTIDLGNLRKFTMDYSYNVGYLQWHYPDSKLQKLLDMVNMTHNIRELQDNVYSGESSGFIHAVNMTRYKDRITLFVTNDSNREVIYNGIESLDIISVTPHRLHWDFSFDEAEVEKHGPATRILY